MKSFISHDVQRIIDFTDSILNKSNAQQCVSITGDKLNILGQVNTIVKFSNSKVHYPSDFLVSSNIQYECVLGWDFINRNRLSLSRGPGYDYFIVGRHGNTPVRDNHESKSANLVGVTHTRASPSSTDRLLCQSTFQSNAVVALLESAIIPPRTEMILEGKLDKSANSKIGLIEPRSGISHDTRQGFSLARVVVEPDQHRVVPLRILNMSQNPIELTAGVGRILPIFVLWLSHARKFRKHPATTGCLRSRAK